jgi:hypothetical protein
MTAITLSIDPLIYNFATPPTYIVSLLTVFLFLLTWYMSKNKDRLDPFLPALWAVTAGLAVSTRADIASIYSLFLGCFLFLTGTVDFKKMFWIIFGAIMVFVLSDPFMWFMPVQHIKDLLVKVVIHYALFVPNILTPLQVCNFSVLTFISIALGAGLIFYKKIPLLLPASLFTTILLMTTVLYNIFLSAKFQDPRYFLPILLVWELLLPFYVFSVVSFMNLKWQKVVYYGFIILFFVYHFALFFYSIWLSHYLPILI